MRNACFGLRSAPQGGHNLLTGVVGPGNGDPMRCLLRAESRCTALPGGSWGPELIWGFPPQEAGARSAKPRHACGPGAEKAGRAGGGAAPRPCQGDTGPRLRRKEQHLGRKTQAPQSPERTQALGGGWKHNFLLEARRRATPAAGRGREDLPRPAPGRG